MKIEFIDRSKQLSKPEKEAAERSLLYALSRFEAAIDRVTIVTSVENGPKGGIDKRCLARVELRGSGLIEATHHATDFGAGLAHLARWLGRKMARELDARRELRRPNRTSLA